MEFSNAQRAQVLTHALPYIQKYRDKIIVIKYGGSAMIDEHLKESVMGDAVLLTLIGVKVVLVHGGGPEINQMLGKIGKESVFHNGLRVTDKETMDVVQMVLAGKVNKTLVNHLEQLGAPSVGLSGLDGHLLEATSRDEKLGFVGDIKQVHPQIILDTLEKGYLPVISTVGYDSEGHIYNINADTAAAEIAAALGAEALISMTDIDGILRDKNDPASLIPLIRVDEAEELKKSGILQGGMLPKADCCIKAVQSGVKKVFVLDGRIPHAIIIELLTDEGLGTMFCN